MNFTNSFTGKKVIFYKSKIQSIEMILNKEQFILQFKENENKSFKNKLA